MIGNHANAWDAATVAINGLSAFVDILDGVDLHVFGNTSGASTITVLVSHDSVHWYTHSTIAANGDFSWTDLVACRYVQLKSSAAVTITATIAAK